jgi:predicted hotdog family 3-hydroxylacyl-ACP dehydratase
MLATRETITDFIPQRGPMLMINNLLEAGEDYATSELLIEGDNVFVENDIFREAGLIENIAQTAAVHLGYHCHKNQKPVPHGFIAAIKHLEIYSMPRVHTSIKTGIKVTNRISEVTLIEGRIEQGGNMICRCEMRVYLNNQ